MTLRPVKGSGKIAIKISDQNQGGSSIVVDHKLKARKQIRGLPEEIGVGVREKAARKPAR